MKHLMKMGTLAHIRHNVGVNRDTGNVMVQIVNKKTHRELNAEYSPADAREFGRLLIRAADISEGYLASAANGWLT